ncbi:MAG: hypothetical protein WCX97_02815 [Candidatus Magasanikbacteria bacterium]
MLLSHERKTIIIISGFAVAIAIIIFAIVLPTINYIQKINNETETLRQYLERRYENAKRMNNSLQEVNQIKETVTRYNQHLFFAGDELTLITELENLATRHQVEQKIDNTNLDKMAGRQVKINLTVNGEYKNILNYIADLHTNNYFLNITSLNWSLASGQNQKINNTQLRIELILYVNE